jgi:putative membrane protein
VRAHATIIGMGIVVRLIVSAIALWITTLVVPGVKLTGNVDVGRQAGTLLIIAAIFGVVNAVLRPIIKMVGCWAYVLTLGLAALVVNGALLLLTSWIASKLDLPFHVDKFWSAVLGALLIGVISWLLNMLVPDKD